MNSPTKRPLALLHGWGLDSRVWEALLPHLTPHFSVTRLQLPGYPGRPDGADSVAATVDALLADVPEGALLLGWSLGGQLAQLMAARAPKRIAGLVLVATSPRFLAGNGWNAGQPASLLGGFSAAVGLAPGPVLPRFATLMNQGDSLAKDINRQLAPLTKAPLAEKAALLRGLDWLRDLDLRPLAPKLPHPALVIHGEADPLMPVEAARWLAAQLPHGQLQLMAEAAHTPFLHDPAAFAGHLQAWAEGLPA